MRKVTMIQRNAYGEGQDRTFTFWVKNPETFIQRKSRAVNMDHTEFHIG